MTEQWLPIPGYEPFYDVSSLGRVRRSAHYEARPIGIRKARVAKMGYYMLALWAHNEGHSEYVHRLVCSAFHGPSNGRQVNHKNGDRLDNRPENLEWVTSSENEHHAMRELGKTNAGERNGQSKLTAEQVLEIRSLHSQGIPNVALSERFGICERYVRSILSRRAWKHI